MASAFLAVAVAGFKRNPWLIVVTAFGTRPSTFIYYAREERGNQIQNIGVTRTLSFPFALLDFYRDEGRLGKMEQNLPAGFKFKRNILIRTTPVKEAAAIPL